MNQAESEARPVLGPAGNKARSIDSRKPISKPKATKPVKPPEADELKGKSPPVLQSPSPSPPSAAEKRKNGLNMPSILRQPSNLSMNASCSSDASTDSSHSRASTGRISRRSSMGVAPKLGRKKQCSPKTEKVEKSAGDAESQREEVAMNVGGSDAFVGKKRCAWVTANTDPCYAAFHDEEWGVPIHDDKKLFELLSLSTALAELTWPTILNRRHTFREVFQNFDPIAVSKLNEKKLISPGSPASSLLSEVKLRGIIENARQICKIMEEIGSFDKYIWGFVNGKPTVGHFRYPRQVPIKTSKAEFISKDLVRRGFRGVGPTVVYSFMQVAGITNDHLISCFRFQDCVPVSDAREKTNGAGGGQSSGEDNETEVFLSRAIVDLNLST